MAKSISLVHPDATLHVPARLLTNKCNLFADDPGLAAFPYHLKSRVHVSDFREFVSALEGTIVNVTNNNFKGLSQLSEEFHFRDLTTQLSQFRASENFKKDAEAQIAISMKEINGNGTFFADRFMFTSANAIFECSVGQAVALSPAVREQLSVDACARTFALNDVSAVDSIRCLLSGDAGSIEGSGNGLGRELCSPGLELALAGTDRFDLDSVDLSVFSVEALDEVLGLASFSIASEDVLLERLLSLGDEYRPLLRRIESRFLSATGLTILTECFASLPECILYSILDRLFRSVWNSVIVPDFPKLFEDFKKKQFPLLWRGSRDGFRARDFHRRCDGHANTLTVILDTEGNIFGGFTPVAWESRISNGKLGTENNCYKADPSLKSFLFTLKNPHNVPAQRFALNADKKDKAIWALGETGPHFGDIVVWGGCKERPEDTGHAAWFGDSYINNTGLKGSVFFTGSENFHVKDIEVFEIID
jgi:hypothetical protein